MNNFKWGNLKVKMRGNEHTQIKHGSVSSIKSSFIVYNIKDNTDTVIIKLPLKKKKGKKKAP